MMNLPQGRSKHKQWFRPTILLIIFVSIYLFRATFGLVIDPIVSYFALPLWSTHNLASTLFERTYIFATKSRQELINDNILLTKEVGRNEMLHRQIDTLTKQNADLKVALGRDYNKTRMLGFVLSSATSLPYETFNIDLGSGSGLEQGDKVYSLDNVILGEIVEVYETRSKVQLFSAYGNKLEVLLDGLTRVVVEGSGSQNFTLSLPHGMDVKLGHIMYWPGGDGSVLAIVRRVVNNPGDAFFRIIARSPVNINEIKEVYVSHE